MAGTGFSLMLALGGSPKDGLAIAGVLRVGSGAGTFSGAPPDAPGGGDAALVQIGTLIDWYPAPAQGWHVGGILGFGGIGMTDAANRTSSASMFVASFFGGYDLWIAPQLSIGLSLVASLSTDATMTDDNQNATGYHFAAIALGLDTSFLVH